MGSLICSRCALVGAVAVPLMLSAAANAFEIRNSSALEMRYTVLNDGTTGRVDPGQSVDFALPPSSSVFLVRIETIGGDSSDNLGFAAQVPVQANGVVLIEDRVRPLEWNTVFAVPVSPFVSGTDNAGNILKTEPAEAREEFRRVSFLASADCQFCEPGDTNCNVDDGPTQTLNEVAMSVNQLMGAKVLGDDRWRGMILAGDLTQSEGTAQRDLYLQSIAGVERHVFDGLGNHDLDSILDVMRPVVRNRKRSTIRTNRGPSNHPHYSWDWHDVHFVQLNVFPSDDAGPKDREPFNALTYLRNDLAANVGDSGRPVVLVHHYGFDAKVGLTWWTEAQRKEYWLAIQDYNVVLILYGHRHLGDGISPVQTDRDLRYQNFERPTGIASGPAEIKAVNVAASRNGAHVEVEINERNQVRTQVINRNNSVVGNRSRTFRFELPIYVSAQPMALTPGGFGWKDDPFMSIARASRARNSAPFAGTNPLLREVRITPGVYTETEVIRGELTITPDRPGDIIIRAN